MIDIQQDGVKAATRLREVETFGCGEGEKVAFYEAAAGIRAQLRPEGDEFTLMPGNDCGESLHDEEIRDPVDIFVSAWHYYKLGGSYKLTLGTLSRVTHET